MYNLRCDQLLDQGTMRSMISVDHCVIGLSMLHGYGFKSAADDVVVNVCSLRAAICVPVSAYHNEP